MSRGKLIMLFVLVVASLSPVAVLQIAPLIGVDPTTLQGDRFQLTGPHLLLMFAFAGVMGGIPLAAYRWLHGGRIAALGFRGELVRNLASGHLVGFAMAALALALEAALSGEVTLSWAVPADVGWVSLATTYLFFVVAIVFLQSLKEEILYRAYPLEVTLGAGQRPYSAVLISAVLFALVHLVLEQPSWLGFANRFLFGVLFCQFYLSSRSIWAPVGVHGGWNWGLSTVGGNWQLGGLWSLSIDDTSPWADLVTPSILALVVALMGWAARTGSLNALFPGRPKAATR